MTNLSPSNKNKKLITPENSLLFAPIFLGVVILSSLIAFIYRPLISKLTDEEAQIEILEEKISYIPLYKKYINDLSITRNKAQKQQQRLIKLISDPNELDTILSEINRISTNNSVEIIKIVPKPVIKYGQFKSGNQNNTTSTFPASNSSDEDPFLIPSIEKHIFKLSLRGEFNRLLDFLKELELIQSIVISDDIDIEANRGTSRNETVNLTMTFNLSTYANVSNN